MRPDLLSYDPSLRTTNTTTSIRLFSKLLRIPADALMKEYKLHP
jgi:hypothetical protein